MLVLHWGSPVPKDAPGFETYALLCEEMGKFGGRLTLNECIIQELKGLPYPVSLATCRHKRLRREVRDVEKTWHEYIAPYDT